MTTKDTEPRRSLQAETLTGYADLGVQPPRPMKLSALQQIRDAVDPRDELETGIRHLCEHCGPCVDDGKVVPGEHVRSLLQHIDYLQSQLDAIEKGSIDYFGDDGNEYG